MKTALQFQQLALQVPQLAPQKKQLAPHRRCRPLVEEGPWPGHPCCCWLQRPSQQPCWLKPLLTRVAHVVANVMCQISASQVAPHFSSACQRLE